MTPATQPAQLLTALNWRYATKAFDTKALPAPLWEALQESLRLAPSSFGLQPWKFFVIADPAVKVNTDPDASASDASPLRPDPDFRTDLLRLVDALRARAEGGAD